MIILDYIILSFHSTKEGFKASSTDRGTGDVPGFHSTKEGFKVISNLLILRIYSVSSPLRKVSRIKLE